MLSEAGPAGLNVVEIAKRIQRQGLRDLRTAKSPEVNSMHSLFPPELETDNSVLASS